MRDANLAVQMVLAFGGGVISFVSPCVLPMVPAYLGMMSGYSTGAITEGGAPLRKVGPAALSFVAGFTVVFVALGAAATSIAQFFRHNQVLMNRVAGSVIVVFGIILMGMAITNRGVFGAMNREHRLQVRPSRLGAWAPPVMGMAFAFGWVPCIGPILAAILALSASQATVGRGALLLLVYALGLGVPFVLSAIGVGRLLGVFERLRRTGRVIMVVSGGLMAAFGILMVTGNVSRLASFLIDVMERIPLLRNLTGI